MGVCCGFDTDEWEWEYIKTAVRVVERRGVVGGGGAGRELSAERKREREKAADTITIMNSIILLA